MRKQILKIKEVYIDNEIYPRESCSQIVVNQYKKDMKFGSIFPPIYIAKFKGKFYLVDGLHRLKAKEELGEEFINTDIQENLKNKLDIYLASIRANLQHGKTLSIKDRLKIAKQLKKMKVDSDNISKLLHIKDKDLERIGLGNIKDIQKLRIKNRDFKSVLTDRKPVEEPIEIISGEDEQIGILNGFLLYLKDTELLYNKQNKRKLIDIEKVIKRILTRMRK